MHGACALGNKDTTILFMNNSGLYKSTKDSWESVPLMNERLALNILNALGRHARFRLKKALLLRRQELLLEITSLEGELRGIQVVIDFSEESADVE